jgi:hypothetical protein
MKYKQSWNIDAYAREVDDVENKIISFAIKWIKCGFSNNLNSYEKS